MDWNAYCLKLFWAPLTQWMDTVILFGWTMPLRNSNHSWTPPMPGLGASGSESSNCIWLSDWEFAGVFHTTERHPSCNLCYVPVPPVSAHIILPLLESTPTGHIWDVGHWHSDSNMLPCSPSTQSVDILVTILLITRSLFCSVRFWSAHNRLYLVICQPKLLFYTGYIFF